LFIIKPVKNTSQTASELQTDGRCVLLACVGFLSGRQPSQPRHHSPGGHLRLTRAIVTTAHAQPARAKMLRSAIAQSGAAEQDRGAGSALPRASRNGEITLLANNVSLPPAQGRRPFCCRGEAHAPRRPAGYSISRVINQGLLPSHLEF